MNKTTENQKELDLIKSMFSEVAGEKDYYLLHSLRRYCEKDDLQIAAKAMSEDVRNSIRVMILKLDKQKFEVDDSKGTLTFVQKEST